MTYWGATSTKSCSHACMRWGVKRGEGRCLTQKKGPSDWEKICSWKQVECSCKCVDYIRRLQTVSPVGHTWAVVTGGVGCATVAPHPCLVSGSYDTLHTQTTGLRAQDAKHPRVFSPQPLINYQLVQPSPLHARLSAPSNTRPTAHIIMAVNPTACVLAPIVELGWTRFAWCIADSLQHQRQ